MGFADFFVFVLQVLRKLRYVDNNNAVQLKGRVACEISNHELIITELVFENAFTNLHPTEIVALLSCFVFQQVRQKSSRAHAFKSPLWREALRDDLNNDCDIHVP